MKTGKNVHLIVGLGKGGAETMLYNILKYGNPDTERTVVVSLGAGDYYKDKILSLNIPVLDINIKKHPFLALMTIRKKLDSNTSIICWMYHANLIGFLLGKIAKTSRIIWNIRHSNVQRANESLSTFLIIKICAFLSHYVDSIIYNGELAKTNHESIGYRAKHSYVLSNGCDLEKYKYISDSRDKLLKELKIENKQIILSVARYAPIKGISTFIQAIKILRDNNIDCVAVMCGKGICTDNKALFGELEANGLLLNKDVFLLGEREDLPRIFSSADLYVLHSNSEAFPNTLIQAMSCETLCISTNVGSVRDLLEDDFIVPIGDSIILSNKIMRILSTRQDWKEKEKKKNREIVKAKYNIKKVVSEYERLFE